MSLSSSSSSSSSSSPSSSPVSTDEESTTTASASTSIRAQIVTDLAACGARLRQGHLVAFPTETVYGLGCHALDVSAVAKVFQAKERPLTDPLIVHVLTADDAFCLWQVPRDGTAGRILQTLCDQFWPGPLTLVAAANCTVVPNTIMAGTGYCAVRSPSHTTARALMAAAQRPLAAPSANKFGHVSPTTAQHVWDDLKYEDVWIVNDNDNNNGDDENSTTETNSRKSLTCDVGVESTVAKLEMNDNNSEIGTLTVLRQGAVSVEDLKTALKDYPCVRVEAKLKRATKDNVANVAPGQTTRHYSPNIPSFLLSAKCIQNTKTIVNGNKNNDHDDDDDDYKILRNAVVIDYGAQLVGWKHLVRAYYDLSPTGDSSLAAQTVFETLRWAEQVPNVDCILFPDLLIAVNNDALALAVKDRLTRAASGVVIDSLASIVVAKKLPDQ